MKSPRAALHIVLNRDRRNMDKLENLDQALTFDDITLVPQYSEIDSRSTVDVSVSLCKGFKFSSPLIPANMSTISGKEMVLYTYSQRSLGILHRFMAFEEKMY